MKSAPRQHPRETPAGSPRFATTHWSVVLATGGDDPTEARAALEELCSAYWYPLYAYVRRRGHSPHDAQDLTQGFFARLLEKDYLAAADRTRGRFRSFLLASLKHYLANEWDRARAKKRGGAERIVRLDARSAEGRYALEPSHELTAERAFERRWALTVLDHVMLRLREQYSAAGKATLFDALKGALAGGREAPPCAEVADGLGMTEGAVRVAAHRLRRRYRDLLRSEIAETVDAPDHVSEELRYLMSVLGT